MAERKSQNKFIPNDYDPKRFRTINNYHKHKQNKLVGRFQQPQEDDIFESLKDRPVDSFHRTITIRFEMPFNIWCLGCQSHVGMGVRYLYNTLTLVIINQLATKFMPLIRSTNFNKQLANEFVDSTLRRNTSECTFQRPYSNSR